MPSKKKKRKKLGRPRKKYKRKFIAVTVSHKVKKELDRRLNGVERKSRAIGKLIAKSLGMDDD